MKITLWTRLARALVLGQKPNYVIAFVTGLCNLSCSFCCYAARDLRNCRPAHELTPHQWGLLFKGLDALMHVTVTGGEPFLRKDLSELVTAIVATSGVPRISINTNGFLPDTIVAMTSEIINQITSVDLSLTVSIDGTESMHDRLRGAPGAYRKARETVFSLASALGGHPRFSLRVASVLCEENAADLEALFYETATWPITFHDLGLVRDVSLGVQQRLASAYQHLAQIQMERSGFWFRMGLEGRLQRQLHREVLKQITGRASQPTCLAGSRLLEVFPDGSVRGCEMASMWEVSLIKNSQNGLTSLKEIVHSTEAKRFREKVHSCQCSFECALGSSLIFKPSRWWRLLF